MRSVKDLSLPMEDGATDTFNELINVSWFTSPSLLADFSWWFEFLGFGFSRMCLHDLWI